MARTLDEIKGRCVIIPVEESGDGKEHWIWKGATNGIHNECIVRAPDWGRDPTGKTTYNMSVQRAIYMVTKKTPVKKGYQFFRTCMEVGCVSPGCTSMATKKRGAVHVSRRIKASPETLARLSAASMRTWDKRGRKVSDEVVQQILLSDKSNKEIAKELGLDPTTPWAYRTGRARKKTAQVALGMFSGLLR